MKSTICILVLLSLLSSCFASCPSSCKCISPEVVDCSWAGLTSIPSLPPTTLNLDLSHNKLTSIPSKAFATAPKLLFLNLNNNRLTSLSPEAFTGVPNLQNLSLANNALPDDLDISSISASNSLINLNLANNMLTKIPAFKVTSLKRLTLSGNTIRSAAFPASFSSCFDLQSVILSENQIGAIAANDFDSLTSLNVVSLRFDTNRITSIDPKALAAIGLSLNNLNLNRNRLTTAALTAALKGFKEVPSIALISLSVSSNAIVKFDESVLAPLAYTMFNSLQLDGHRMLELDPKAFQSVSRSLKILSLRDCGLSSVPAALSPLSLLQTLRLDGNSFEDLPSDLPPSLVDLSMTRNGLRGWTDDALSRLGKLLRLDVSKNNLETVTNNATNPLHSCTGRLNHLDLTQNPFNCSCDLAWFATWAGSKAGKAVYAFKTLKCTSPDQMAGMLLKDVNMSQCGADPNPDDEDSSGGYHDEESKQPHHKKRPHEESAGSHHKKKKHPHHKKKPHEESAGRQHHKKKHPHHKKKTNGDFKKQSSKKKKHHHKKHHHDKSEL